MPKEDIEDIIDIDVSDIRLLSKETRIRLKTGEDTYMILRPIATQFYYDYLENKESEFLGRSKIIQRCLVSPEKSLEEVQDLPIITFNMLFDYLMEYSFLKKTKAELLKD